MQKEDFILKLTHIRNNNFELPKEESLQNYTDLMLENIGDSNPLFRDNLIYTIFYYWIMEKNYYTNVELQRILTTVTDEKHLFYKIGNHEDPSVFTRTFSILLVALILSKHKKNPIFDANFFMKTKNDIVNYYSQEKDLRGYLDEFGWAHGAAHGADALDELIQCKESNDIVCRDVLKAIKNNLNNEIYIYSNEEDERISIVLYRILENNYLSQDILYTWLNDLSSVDMKISRQTYISFLNVRNLIRSFYFRIIHKGEFISFGTNLLELEKNMNRFLNY